MIGRSDETQAKQLLEEETVIGRSDETEEKSTITLSTQTCIICNGTTNNSNYDVSQYAVTCVTNDAQYVVTCVTHDAQYVVTFVTNDAQ